MYERIRRLEEELAPQPFQLLVKRFLGWFVCARTMTMTKSEANTRSFMWVKQNKTELVHQNTYSGRRRHLVVWVLYDYSEISSLL